MTMPARIEPRLVVEIKFISASPRRTKVAIISCTPVPTDAQKSSGYSGKRKTSPWINFHPDYSVDHWFRCCIRKGKQLNFHSARKTYLLFLEAFVVQLHIPREVVLEHPHQYDRQECRQQEHKNERVDDAQPVNLERSRKKP